MKYQIRYVVAKTTEDEKVGKLKKGTVLWEGEADTVRDGYRAARQALPEQLGRSLQRLYDEGVVGRGADPR